MFILKWTFDTVSPLLMLLCVTPSTACTDDTPHSPASLHAASHYLPRRYRLNATRISRVTRSFVPRAYIRFLLQPLFRWKLREKTHGWRRNDEFGERGRVREAASNKSSAYPSTNKAEASDDALCIVSTLYL
jgi:hypothetical protein